MTKVLFLPEVADQFLELAEVLYQQGYLGLKGVAVNYSEQLFRDIQNTLPVKVKKDAPSYFKRYGNDLFYSSFPKSRHTTWYVFYSIQSPNAFRLQLADGFNKEYWRQFDEKVKYSRELLTSCWSTSIIEDALMWKSFNAEIRIKTTTQKLFDAISDPDINIVICDQIKYDPEHPIYTLRDALFYKELSYRNEQEIRFYFDKCRNRDQEISINPNNLIDEVLISPFINNKAQILLKNIKEEFAYLSLRESMIIEKWQHEN